MFYGRIEHSIDEKGRLTIPYRYRTMLENGIYLMPGLDGNLMLMPAEFFQKISDEVANMNMADPVAREYMRQFFANTEQVSHDDAWRILISQNLRQLGHLNSSAIIVGSGQYIEIWSPEMWEVQQKRLADPSVSGSKFASLKVNVVKQ